MGDNRTLAEETEELLQIGPDNNSKLWRSAVAVEDPVTVEITGKIPAWLNGNYLRVGPGKFDLKDDFSMNSWLDGFAIASKFTVDAKQNCVSFESKYLESQAYIGAIKYGKPIFPEYGTKKYLADPAKGFFSSMISNFVPEMSDNPQTSYLKYDTTNSKIFVGGESCYFHEFDPATMKLGERFDSKELFGFQLCSIHPMPCSSNDGTVYNIGTSILTGVRYNIFKISSLASSSTEKNAKLKDSFKKSFKILCTIPSRWTTGMAGIHSFGQTSNYIVLIEQPYVANVKKTLGNALKGKIESLKSSMEWFPELGNRFYIVSKSTGEILNKSFEILSESPFFYVHIINCFEDYCKSSKTSYVVVDISYFETPSTLNAQDLKQLRSTKNGFECNCTADLSLQATVQRFIIPLSLDGKRTPANVNLLESSGDDNETTTISSNEPSTINNSKATAVRSGKSQILLTPKLVMRKGLEFPSLNPSFVGKPYQYFYASGLVTMGEFQNAIAKVNAHNSEVIVHRENSCYIYGEPIFVPEPESQQEDAGVLIIPMTDARKDYPDMILFLNAADMTELGRAIFNVRIPPAIHGAFIPK